MKENEINQKNQSGVIPAQTTGKIIDATETVEFNDSNAAKSFYQIAKKRLTEVNNWHDLAGALSASFQLIDENGQEAFRPVQQGDYFKIDIPGPGPTAGDGFDWVRVEEVNEVSEHDTESIGIRVRPAKSPLNKSDDVAHFYSPESTSNFTVTREGNKLTVGIYDRNTKTNDTPDTITDIIRDSAVGMGAITAFSKLQWESLIDGILKKDE